MELEKRRAEKRSEVRFSLGLTRVWIEVIKSDYFGFVLEFQNLNENESKEGHTHTAFNMLYVSSSLVFNGSLRIFSATIFLFFHFNFSF
jgi:hypothetical protein